MGYKYTFIGGNFNFPEMNWDTWTVNRGETHPAFYFVECIRDNYLFQNIQTNTRYTHGQVLGCLDLLLTDLYVTKQHS